MDSLRCQYASKPCEQARSFKDNGELHRLCIYHRARANDAQRRWHSRQRGEGASTRQAASDDQVSERTKRRRRAAQAAREGAPLAQGAARRPRCHTRLAKPTLATAAPPGSPPSVDSATFGALLRAPLAPETYSTTISFPVLGCPDEQMSTEDLALLDELMLCIDETKPTANTISVDQQQPSGFFDLAWPPVSSATPYFV